MKIPVFEQHDGEAYNGFTKVTTADIVPTHNGTMATVKKVQLRRVLSRHGYMTRSLPCNHHKLTDDQILQALKNAQYGYMMVSRDGERMLQRLGLPLTTRFN